MDVQGTVIFDTSWMPPHLMPDFRRFGEIDYILAHFGQIGMSLSLSGKIKDGLERLLRPALQMIKKEHEHFSCQSHIRVWKGVTSWNGHNACCREHHFSGQSNSSVS